MYKVFVNEKKLTLSNEVASVEKNLVYSGLTTLEIAIDLLENTSCPEINVYGNNVDEIWQCFKNSMKVIEAAGGIVQNQDQQLLFIYRLGKWDLPKGKIEPGESLETAAIREVEEETAIKNLTINKFLNTTYHLYKEKKQGLEMRVLKTTHWFEMTFSGEETPVPQIEEGITKVEWKSEKDIMFDVYPNTFQNIQIILSEHWENKKGRN